MVTGYQMVPALTIHGERFMLTCSETWQKPFPGSADDLQLLVLTFQKLPIGYLGILCLGCLSDSLLPFYPSFSVDTNTW